MKQTKTIPELMGAKPLPLTHCLKSNEKQYNRIMRKVAQRLKYFPIPEMPGFLISTDGILLTPFEKIYRPIRSKTSYPYYEMYGVRLKTHRLMALAFVSKPPNLIDIPYSRLMVNHLDGNKSNWQYTNLEWVSASRNAVHAFESNLRSDSSPLLVKDIRTEKVQRFFSIRDCARFFKRSAAAILAHLKATSEKPRLYQNFYVIIRDGGTWPDPDSLGFGNYTDINLPKPLIGKKDNESPVFFESISALVKTYGRQYKEVSRILSLAGVYEINGWEFRFIDDPILFEQMRVSLGKKKIDRLNKPVPIRVTDILTGETTNWISTEAFADELKVLKKTIQKSMNRTGGFYKGWKIDYLEPTKKSERFSKL